MEFEYKDILLSQIDHADVTFLISTEESVESLKASIQRVGLIQPPILISKSKQEERENKYAIVVGFRRIRACRELGWGHLKAMCLESDTPFIRCALAAVSGNLSHRKLNLVEAARCFALLENETDQSEEIYQTLASIGLQSNKEMIAKLKKIADMGDLLQQGLILGSIALPVALELHAMSDESGAKALTGLLLELNLSLSRQRETLDWIQAIAHREKLDIERVLGDEAVRRCRRDTTVDAPRKANVIRALLRKRRYPEISAHEQKYANALKSLTIPKSLHIIPPAHFESPSYGLKIDFKTADGLDKRLEEARKMVHSPSFISLLKTSKSE